MKIAYIYPALSTVGGADRVISDKANFFAEHCSYEVYIITAHQNGLPLSFPLSPKVKHIDLGVNFNKQYKHTFFVRGFIYLKLLRIYKRRLSKLLNELRVDITLTSISRDVDFLTTLKDGSLKIAEAHVAKRFIRNNHLLQQRGGLFLIIGKIWAWRLEQSLKKFDQLVVLTQNDAARWRRFKKAAVIPNSLPFLPSKTSTCSNRKIISVGRLEEQKGYDLLIAAWERIHAQYPGWSIDVYGEGSLLRNLQAEIDARGLSESFFLKAPVKNIQEKYLDASVYVMSSRFEGFGMVLIEAMACGLPVVSFNCPEGPSEIIRDGHDGFLVANGNVEALAERISFLISQEDVRKRFGQSARENVQRYAPAAIMHQWVSLFEQLTARDKKSFRLGSSVRQIA